MKTFTDSTGRAWTVNINVDALKRVRSLMNVNLMEVVEGKLLERLVSDPILLCDVIYCIVKPQADAKEITDEDFGRAMAGDAIDHASTALLEELVDFFPLGKRQVLKKALAKLKQLEAMALEVAEKRLDSKELDDLMAECLSGEAPAGSRSPAGEDAMDAEMVTQSTSPTVNATMRTHAMGGPESGLTKSRQTRTKGDEKNSANDATMPTRAPGGDSSGSLPESSASIPDHSPSAS